MNEIEKTMRAALYIRVSTEKQEEEGYGLDMQKEALLAYIQSRGKFPGSEIDRMVLAGEEYIYVDEISGTMPVDERPGFAKLKEDILLSNGGACPFDIVLVFKIDRFARRLKVLLDIVDFLESSKVEFVSLHENIDTSSPFGKAILSIIGVIAELELENIKIRTQGGRGRAVNDGVAMGAYAPFGYKKDEYKRLQVFEPEAKVVRQIFNMFVYERLGTQEIATRLTKLGIASPGSSAGIHHKRKSLIGRKNPIQYWRNEEVRKKLSDERYIGTYYYNRYGKRGSKKPREEWKKSDYQIPSIVSRVLFQQAQTLLGEQVHIPHRLPEHAYLLSGLLRCDTCYDPTKDKSGRERWIGTRRRLENGAYTYFYLCGRKNTGKVMAVCSTISLPADEIERIIVGKCRDFISDPEGVFEYQQKLSSTKGEIRRIESKREHLARLLSGIPGQIEALRAQHQLGVIDTEKLSSEHKEMKERKKRLEEELNKLDEEISKVQLSESYSQIAEEFAKNYQTALENIETEEDRRAAARVLSSLIQEIVVFSRPVEVGKDIVAGQKSRKAQQIPYRLHVKLRLPQEIIGRLTVNPREVVEVPGTGDYSQKRQNGGDGGS